MALLLVLNSAGEVLLQRRPPTGLWGGLDCLPVLDDGESPPAWARRRLGAATFDAVSPAPSFEHVFTHFRCSITPWRCLIRGVGVVAENDLRWLSLDAAQTAALPTPVRRILGDQANSTA
jgi:A/G-specific adenine glycosylase